MTSLLLDAASVYSRSFLLLLELSIATLTGSSIPRVLNRERRRRRYTALRHYTRSMEDFPELLASLK